jgi:uncharacterized membrane protein YgdD (TMEM256/DUF423 family)
MGMAALLASPGFGGKTGNGMMFERFGSAIAGLAGAAGVAALAAGAHGGAATGLFSAGILLLANAAAALVLAVPGLPMRAGVRRAALVLLLGGAWLFAADMAARAFLDGRLFPMAAPAGGTIAIAGWSFVALAALIGPRRPV